MQTKWPTKPFGELTENFDSVRIPVREADRTPGPYPYYGASGIVDCVDKYLFDGEYLLVAEDGENLKTRQTPIAFLATGRFWVNNHAHVVRANNQNNTRYLMYAMRCADVDSYLTGSTMPKLTQANMNRVPVVAPPLEIQRAIAHILGALDDKIELNRKMNETLEAMARALFKSWFVDFDPVRAKAEGRAPSGMDAETAKLFPSEFVDSELGPIPKGWRRTVLSEAAELNPKRALKKGALAPYVEMSSLPTSGHRPSQWPMRPVGSGARFQNGDTLLARITPCLENGKTAFVDFLGEGEVGWGSTEYIVIAPRAPLPAEWGYLLARDETFRDFAKQKMEGSTGRQRVPAGALGQYLVTVPPAHVAARFGQIVRSWFQRMARGYEESSTLARLRDELLPRLLSGELPVDAAERVVEEVA